MPPIGLIIMLALLNLWSFRAVARHFAARRHPVVPPPPDGRKTRRPISAGAGEATASAAAAAISPAIAPEPSAPRPVARAFPVLDLPADRASAGVLQTLLSRLGGVKHAYVSPVTSLAYVDYFPAQLTEDDLVGAIRAGGYDVGAMAQRFDWRHGFPG